MSFAVTSFYKFRALAVEELAVVRAEFLSRCESLNIKGLIVLAPEGVNSTVAGSADSIAAFKKWLQTASVFAPVECKDSSAEREPFRRLRIDMRPEIVTFGHPVASAEVMEESFLTPEEWHARFQGAEAPIVIDVRNSYETALGKFKGAIDPNTDVFTDLPAFVEKSNLPTDREILTYCTGGIRCEKALGFLHGKGYKIRQLSGGILKYLEKFPNGAFEGECFVFDHRVAVDQDLAPSKRYSLCVHCGDPAEEKLSCLNCGAPGIVCVECRKHHDRHSCSKNCAYHVANKKASNNARSALVS